MTICCFHIVMKEQAPPHVRCSCKLPISSWQEVFFKHSLHLPADYYIEDTLQPNLHAVAPNARVLPGCSKF